MKIYGNLKCVLSVLNEHYFSSDYFSLTMVFINQRQRPKGTKENNICGTSVLNNIQILNFCKNRPAKWSHFEGLFFNIGLL